MKAFLHYYKHDYTWRLNVGKNSTVVSMKASMKKKNTRDDWEEQCQQYNLWQVTITNPETFHHVWWTADRSAQAAASQPHDVADWGGCPPWSGLRLCFDLIYLRTWMEVPIFSVWFSSQWRCSRRLQASHHNVIEKIFPALLKQCTCSCISEGILHVSNFFSFSCPQKRRGK